MADQVQAIRILQLRLSNQRFAAPLPATGIVAAALTWALIRGRYNGPRMLRFPGYAAATWRRSSASSGVPKKLVIGT